MRVQSIAALGVAALAMTCWATLRMAGQRRLSRQHPDKPVPLLTWEGEGGTLPDAAPAAGTASDTASDTGGDASAASGAKSSTRE